MSLFIPIRKSRFHRSHFISSVCNFLLISWRIASATLPRYFVFVDESPTDSSRKIMESHSFSATPLLPDGKFEIESINFIAKISLLMSPYSSVPNLFTINKLRLIEFTDVQMFVLARCLRYLSTI